MLLYIMHLFIMLQYIMPQFIMLLLCMHQPHMLHQR